MCFGIELRVLEPEFLDPLEGLFEVEVAERVALHPPRPIFGGSADWRQPVRLQPRSEEGAAIGAGEVMRKLADGPSRVWVHRGAPE